MIFLQGSWGTTTAETRSQTPDARCSWHVHQKYGAKVLVGVLWTRLMGLHGLGATLNHCHYRQFQPMVNVESIQVELKQSMRVPNGID
jgi:hypothetical protein